MHEKTVMSEPVARGLSNPKANRSNQRAQRHSPWSSSRHASVVEWATRPAESAGRGERLPLRKIVVISIRCSARIDSSVVWIGVSSLSLVQSSAGGEAAVGYDIASDERTPLALSACRRPLLSSRIAASAGGLGGARRCPHIYLPLPLCLLCCSSIAAR